VSRALSSFHERELIKVRQKHVRILDFPGLKAVLDPKR
jgi:hypothetical protein